MPGGSITSGLEGGSSPGVSGGGASGGAGGRITSGVGVGLGLSGSFVGMPGLRMISLGNASVRSMFHLAVATDRLAGPRFHRRPPKFGGLGGGIGAAPLSTACVLLSRRATSSRARPGQAILTGGEELNLAQPGRQFPFHDGLCGSRRIHLDPRVRRDPVDIEHDAVGNAGDAVVSIAMPAEGTSWISTFPFSWLCASRRR